MRCEFWGGKLWMKGKRCRFLSRRITCLKPLRYTDNFELGLTPVLFLNPISIHQSRQEWIHTYSAYSLHSDDIFILTGFCGFRGSTLPLPHSLILRPIFALFVLAEMSQKLWTLSSEFYNFYFHSFFFFFWPYLVAWRILVPHAGS